jgi:DNA-nicking Smr family endonuclease
MTRGKRTLSTEEFELWKQVRRTVKPLAPDPLDREIEEWIDHTARDMPAPIAVPTAPAREQTPFVPPPMPPYVPPVSKPGDSGPPATFDQHTIRRIKKGRIEIDSRIDLHGLTEIEAHRRLFDFLRQCQQQEARIVLVITGKGKSGAGVLRRAVPLWFEEGAFRTMIGGFRPANPAHGGDGALYVRLRRVSGKAR